MTVNLLYTLYCFRGGEKMTIKDVEKRLNVSRANIRFYEKEGLLKPKRNDDNEYRDYSDDDIKRLEKILLFRKCNISIEDIRLIFNGTKSIDEVFRRQVSVIENEVKQLEGAKIMCEKLAQEKSSVDDIDTNKYINMMEDEEEKGNKFYSITEDYIFATERLYQSIIENKEFKKGDKMKNKVRVLVYIVSFICTVLLFALFDYFFNKNIDWEWVIYFTTVMTVIDLVGVKKYIEKKNGKKFTKKDNINHFIIIMVIMVVSLLGYFTVKSIINVYSDPKDNVLELSVKKSIIEIASDKYQNDGNYIYAESHKILDYEVKNNEIYVYVATNYGILNKDGCEVVQDTKDIMTMIYKKGKNDSGTYELKEYKENSIPGSLKNKINVNYEDTYFKSQLNSYCS